MLELKRVGRPLLLVLNMIDIARRRGIEIDLDRLSAELGVPVITSAAVRRGGTDELLRRLDELAAAEQRDRRRKQLARRRAPANCAPRSAKPTASCKPPSACRRSPTR